MNALKKNVKWLFILISSGCTTGNQPRFDVDEFANLHRKVYSVYGIALSPDPIHNLLGEVFSGEALTKEYIEHYTARVHMKEDSTAIEIRQVDYNEVVFLSQYQKSIELDVDWSVGGIVTHQKHKHPRVNRYRAVFLLERMQNDQWRITDTKMKSAQRIQRAGIQDADFFEGKKTTGGYLDPLDLIDAGVFDEEGD